jgi:hypothetical protein
MPQIIKEFSISIILLTLSLYITASNFDITEITTIGYYSALLLLYVVYKKTIDTVVYDIDASEAQRQSVVRHFFFIILLLLILKVTATKFDETELNTIILFSVFTLLQSLFCKEIFIKNTKKNVT